MVAAKLELGDTQTLAHQENGVWVLNEIPNYAEELAKCQRYFINLKGQYGTYFRYGIANAFSSTIAMAEIPLPVTMRTASPALATSNVHLQSGGTTIEVTGVTFRGLGPNAVYVDLAVASGLTTGAMYLVKGDHPVGGGVTNDGYFQISCEL